MPQEVELALELQRMDRLLFQLQVEIRSLPKRISELEAKLQDYALKLEGQKVAAAAKEKEVHLLQTTNEDHRLKIAKLKKQLMQATTPEQLAAFNKEIAWGEAEVAKGEANLLKLLADSEALSTAARQAEANLESERLATAEAIKAATEKSETDRKKGTRIYRDREAAAKAMPPKLMQNYDRLRKKHKDGIIVGEVENEMCMACQMKVRPALMQQIRQAPETLFFCESCSRILYYNPPRSVDGIPVHS